MSKDMFIICGPCSLETEEHALELAGQLKEITAEAGFEMVFKGSFDKANRTSVSSYRGVGIDKGLDIFCLLYTSPSPRDQRGSRMPSSA